MTGMEFVSSWSRTARLLFLSLQERDWLYRRRGRVAVRPAGYASRCRAASELEQPC